MYQETVILTGHKVPWSGTNKFGKPSVLNVFTDTQGREFSTFKQDIAAQLLATMGQQVTLSFKTRQNGEFVNYDIEEVVGGIVGGAAVVAQAAVTAPQTAPVTTPGPAPQGENQETKQLRIMRQNAIGNAVLAFGAAGIDPVTNSAELLEFAQEVLLDFYLNGFTLTSDEPVTVDAGVTAGPVA